MKTRRIKIGILVTPDLDLKFRERIRLVRGVDDYIEEKGQDAFDAFLQDSMAAYEAVTGKMVQLDADAKAFNWTEFFEFLKWLIPLLIEFLGPIIGVSITAL